MNIHLIKRPIISEKSLTLASTKNVYTFEVEPAANKDQIKEVVEQLYEVTVLNVNTTMQNADVRRTGRRRLSRPVGRVKKAMVTLKEGDSIELFDVYNQ